MKRRMKVLHIQPPCPKCDSLMEYKDWRKGKPHRLICPECGMIIPIEVDSKNHERTKERL